MTRPTVSVVIPARDDARALARCLVLLAQQTVAPYDVVVVDNDSSDDTAEVARRHGARVVTEPRVGIPSAAATGYDAARGEVIARLDADSRPAPDWVARVADALADGRLDAVTGPGWFHDLPPVVRRLAAAAYLGAYFALGHLAAGHPVLWGSSLALRRTTWLQVRHRVHRDDPEVHDDLDLSLALGPGSVIRVDRRLAVGASARSLRGGAQLRRRFARAFHTLSASWAEHPPWLRWRDHLAATAAGLSGGARGRAAAGSARTRPRS